MKKVAAFLLIAGLCIACAFPAAAASLDRLPYDSYTYWQKDGSKMLAGSRAMVEVESVITGQSAGTEPFSPSDLAVGADGTLYVLDGENGKLFLLDETGRVKGRMDAAGGETFVGASGVAVTPDGTVYLADTENMRVLVVGANGALLRVLTCPDAEIIPDDFEFRPLQLTVDKNGYLYVLSKGSFYGALVFSPTGETEGFFGANKVSSSVEDLLDTVWNRWFLTDRQRASQIRKIPYQFSDLQMDENGLLYTTTGATTNSATQYGQIRCLGPSGVNVLKKRIGRKSVSADSYNFADQGIAALAVGKRVQNFVSLDVAGGFIYALDQTYGKIYIYSKNCELLTVFGGGVGKGTQVGTFMTASAVCCREDRIFVADRVKGSITVFRLNEYGKTVQQAARLTGNGELLAAKPLWESTLQTDRNCQLAYSGLARAALAEGDNRAAMRYARQGMDRGLYDQAFETVRNEWIGKNISWLLCLAFAALIGLPVAWALIRRRFPKRAAASRLSLAVTAWAHPFERFRAVKYAGKGSFAVALGLLAAYYLSDVLKDYYSGFAHSDFNPENYNSLLVLMGSVGVVLLWVICNWAVSVLAEGKAKMKEVFFAACYSLVPMIFGNLFCLLASNVLLQKEAAAMTVVATVCMILTGLTLCIGTMIVHEFDFFKFLWTAALTLLAMAIVIFLGFMIVILLQQFFAFIHTVFVEVAYR